MDFAWLDSFPLLLLFFYLFFSTLFLEFEREMEREDEENRKWMSGEKSSGAWVILLHRATGPYLEDLGQGMVK